MFGLTLFDGAEATLLPVAFVAVTVNVYAVPFARPPIVMGLWFRQPVHRPPGDAVTVYDRIGRRRPRAAAES